MAKKDDKGKSPKKSGKSKPGKPAKIDKETRKAVKQLMASDSSLLTRKAATLVVFAVVAWPTVAAFGAGTLPADRAMVRLGACALFALVSVAVVSAVVGSYRGPKDPGDGGDVS